jgi:hypothetical protein
MHALAANLFQVGMLGLGVYLLLIWTNHLKARRDRPLSREQNEGAAEGATAPQQTAPGPKSDAKTA